MKIFTSLKKAQDAERAGAIFRLIHRVAEDHWDAYEDGDVLPQAVDPADALRAQCDFLVEQALDAQAASMGYRDMRSAASYATSQHPIFGMEARALVAWRDAAWQYCLDLQQAIAGGAPIPSPEVFSAGLPPFPLVD